MAKYANIFVDQGGSFTETIELDNSDGTNFIISDYAVVAKAKKHYQSATEINFSSSIDIVNSVVTITLSKAQTSALSVANYIYYVFIINNITGESIKIVEGTMIVSPGITT